MSLFAETRPHVYTRQEAAGERAKRQVIFGLIGALIAVFLSIAAFASLMLLL
jgi:hypothetical protein